MSWHCCTVHLVYDVICDSHLQGAEGKPQVTPYRVGPEPRPQALPGQAYPLDAYPSHLRRVFLHGTGNYEFWPGLRKHGGPDGGGTVRHGR